MKPDSPQSARIEAETTLELVAQNLEKAGLVSTVDYEHRRITAATFTFEASIDLDDATTIEKASDFIASTAAGRPIVFSRLECPKAVELCINLHSSKETIVARFVRAYDVANGKMARRLDFLFKIA